MAEIHTVVRRVQIGPEALGTRGTPVAADVRLRTMQWTFSPEAEFNDFRATGDKYGTQEQYLREWTTFSIEGIMDFNEIVYPLSSAINSATASVAGTSAGATSYLWTFNSNNAAPDTPRSFSMEVGDGVAGQAQVCHYALFDSLELSVEQNVASIGGGGFAKKWLSGSSLTSAPEELTLRPILPSYFNVYIDTTAAGLGGTKLNQAFVANFSLANRFGPVWVIDRDNAAGFDAHVELAADLSFTLQLMADSTAYNLLPVMRAGDTRFIRLEAVGAGTVPGTALTNLMYIDFAGQVMEAPAANDREGAYTWEYTFRGINDPTWGKAYQIQVRNTVSAL